MVKPMDQMNLDLNEIEYRRASIEEIIQLRHDLLIVGTDRTSPYFDGDHDPTTFHFGVFYGDQVIGCLTFIRKDWENHPAWQLRGMAIHPDYQGKGVGKWLLQEAETWLLEQFAIRLLWCNARTDAVPFYQKQGWQLRSDEFIIPGVGPHFKMTKEL